MRKRRKVNRGKRTICSKQELLIGKELRKKGVKFISSFKVERKVFDFYFPEYNLLIEYNGTYFHCDPRTYSFDYYNKCKRKTAQEIWDTDKEKADIAILKGYKVEAIWESDYKKDRSIFFKVLRKYKKKSKKKLVSV